MRHFSLVSQPNNSTSQSGNLFSQSDNLVSQPGNLFSQSENLVSQSDDQVSQPENLISQPENLISQPDSEVVLCSKDIDNCVQHDGVHSSSQLPSLEPANEFASQSFISTIAPDVSKMSSSTNLNNNGLINSKVNGYNLRSMDQPEKKTPKLRRISKLTERIHNVDSRIPTPANSSVNLTSFVGKICVQLLIEYFVQSEIANYVHWQYTLQVFNSHINIIFMLFFWISRKF